LFKSLCLRADTSAWCDAAAERVKALASRADRALARSGAISTSDLNDIGAVAGGQIGYNWQFSPAWVLGIEADLSGTSLRGTGDAPLFLVNGVLPGANEFSEASHMLVIVTYDENGGFWDHVAPPKGDRWGPGSRVPTIIISPFAKRHYVDHTQYDTTSILRFITRRFGPPELFGNAARDAALKAGGSKPTGDLTKALNLSLR
jgi:hypothetical protein